MQACPWLPSCHISLTNQSWCHTTWLCWQGGSLKRRCRRWRQITHKRWFYFLHHPLHMIFIPLNFRIYIQYIFIYLRHKKLHCRCCHKLQTSEWRSGKKSTMGTVCSALNIACPSCFVDEDLVCLLVNLFFNWAITDLASFTEEGGGIFKHICKCCHPNWSTQWGKL